VVSEGVTATCAGTATNFTVTADHASDSYTTGCVWVSNPGNGQPEHDLQLIGSPSANV
jgi:hypothetical protein